MHFSQRSSPITQQTYTHKTATAALAEGAAVVAAAGHVVSIASAASAFAAARPE